MLKTFEIENDMTDKNEKFDNLSGYLRRKFLKLIDPFFKKKSFIVETNRKINNKKTRSVMEDIPPSIFMLFDFFNPIFYFSEFITNLKLLCLKYQHKSFQLHHQMRLNLFLHDRMCHFLSQMTALLKLFQLMECF